MHWILFRSRWREMKIYAEINTNKFRYRIHFFFVWMNFYFTFPLRENSTRFCAWNLYIHGIRAVLEGFFYNCTIFSAFHMWVCVAEVYIHIHLLIPLSGSNLRCYGCWFNLAGWLFGCIVDCSIDESTKRLWYKENLQVPRDVIQTGIMYQQARLKVWVVFLITLSPLPLLPHFYFLFFLTISLTRSLVFGMHS